MAALTRTEMGTAVTARVKRDTTNIDANVGYALKRIVNRFNFPALQGTTTVNTAADTINAALASDFKALYDDKSVVFNVASEGRHLKIILPGQYFDDYPRPEDTDTDEPTYITVYGREFLFYPIPDAIYEIKYRYHKYHATWEAGVSHSLGEECDRAIMAIAIAMTYEDFQEMNDAMYWYNIGEQELASILNLGESGITQISRKPLYL